MLSPKRTKFRKQHRGKMRGLATNGNTLDFGDFALQAIEPSWITARQIEAARIAMTRFIKRGGKVWIRMFPDKPITKKPAETRMGKGKGAKIDAQAKPVGPGVILAEIRLRRRLSRHSAFFLDCLDWLKRASSRFSVRTRVALSDF